MHESVGCSEAENLKVRDSLHVYEQRKKDRHSVLVGWVLYMLRETLECSDGESLRVRRLGMGINQQSQHMRVVDLANI